MIEPWPQPPGRTCPLAFRYRPEDLAGCPAEETETLFVAGGAYGNPFAIEAILQRAQLERIAETDLGKAAVGETVEDSRAVTVVLNGDIHYFDVHDKVFDKVASLTGRVVATLGNVEYAISQVACADDEAPVGCGCAYPAHIANSVVARSNAIVERLAATARRNPRHQKSLAALPRYLRYRVGDLSVGIVHGDLHSVAGWQLALPALIPVAEEARRTARWSGTPTTPADIDDWLARADIDVLCCSHTGQAYLQTTGRHVVVNNGSAGMPTFAGGLHGVVTRIGLARDWSKDGAPADSLYGVERRDVRIDALPVAYDQQEWEATFRSMWPEGSVARVGYRDQLHGRVTHDLAQALRVLV